MSRKLLAPRTAISPLDGWLNPASTRRRVVFPAPLSPRIAYSLAPENSAVTPRRAAKRPNCLIRFETVMTLTSAVSVNGIGKRELIRHSGRSGVLVLRHALTGVWSGSRLSSRAWGWCVLRRALRLQLLGV